MVLEDTKLVEPKVIIEEKVKEKSREKIEEEIEKKAEEKTKKLKKRNWPEQFKTGTIDFFKNKYNLLFVAVVVLALLFRLKYFRMEALWNDAAVHLWYAIKVTKEPLFMFSQHYMLGDYAVPQTVTAILYLFIRNVFVAGKIMALIYGTLGLIFIYLLGAELRDKFTGLMAAILLAFNHIFYFYTVYPLGDAPLAVSVIIFLYCLVKLEKENKLKWSVLTGITLLLTMFHKVQASIFLLGFVIYYLLFKRKEMIRNKSVLYSWLIPVGVVFFGEFIARTFLHRSLLGRLFGLMLDLRGMPFGLEAFGMMQWIFTWYLIFFAILGIFLVGIYREKKYYGMIALFFTYWLYFEIVVDNTQDRYILPLLSMGILLALFALVEISSLISLFAPLKIKLIKFPLRKVVKSILILSAVGFLTWQYYNIADPLVYNKSFSFTGYQEAGQWFKENTAEDDIIFAGSPRMMRAFVGREYQDCGQEDCPYIGGPVWWLRADRYLVGYVGDKEKAKQNFVDDLERLVKDHDVYVEIDIWEYTQPEWYWQINQQSLQTFFDLGFDLVHVVERDVQTNKGLQKQPVIFIFRRYQDTD